MYIPSPKGKKHETEEGSVFDYYAKVKYNIFEVLRQPQGNVLYYIQTDIKPTKIVLDAQGNIKNIQQPIEGESLKNSVKAMC